MPRARRILRWIVLALLLVAAARAFCLQSQVVVSGSMAETLVGPHHDVTCGDCGYHFACDADPPVLARAVCPNCGLANERLDSAIGGSHLWVDRAAFYWHAPRRWDVVVFHSPDAAGDPTVKRVVGLPGETISIRDGDVFADGRILRKPLDMARALAVPVHDTAFAPGRVAAVPPRWVAQGDWRAEGSGFVLPRSDAPDMAWLEYRHWQRLATRPAQVEETPIRDDDAYNAGRSRRLHDVHDLLLSCGLRASGSGQLTLRLRDGWQEFELVLEPATGRIELKHDASVLAAATLPAPLLPAETTLEVALVDEQVICALNGTTCLTHSYESEDRPRTATPRPLAIGARGLSVEIARLQLFRDVYYTDPPLARDQAARAARLGPDEYFVLGDNSPVSSDSRTWDQPALPARNLIGQPLGVR